MGPEKLIVHSSASAWGTALDIYQWHTRDNGWKHVGYHAVITNGFPTAEWYRAGKSVRILDGQITMARPFDADEDLEAHEQGAHCYGFNSTTLGVCLIGGMLKNGTVQPITRNQIVSLVKYCKWMDYHFGLTADDVCGHYEMPTAGGKTCPDIDMDLLRELIGMKSKSMSLLDQLAGKRKEA